MWMINSEKQNNPRMEFCTGLGLIHISIGTFDHQELLYQDLHHVHQDTLDKEGKPPSKDYHNVDFSIDFLKKHGFLLAKI